MDASHSPYMVSAARFHALRLLPGEDPVLSLRRLSAETGLHAGFVAGAVGSLSRAVLRFAGCPDGTVRDGCFEIVSLIGTLDAAGEH
ncbi:MAG: PPC domain-containing DNA-binding protein, partial [Fretibacterium sp.]